MSSADATVGDTVVIKTRTTRSGVTARATVLAVLLVTQLVWIAVLVYGAVWLLT